MSGKTRIYLDNNATTPLAPEVYEAMVPWLRDRFGNAASVHWYGQQARSAVDAARRTVAELIDGTPHEIVFTSSGTEADNLAIFGAAQALHHQGNHLITTAIEHPAVLSACKTLERRGFEVTYLGVDGDGFIDLDELRSAVRPETILISIMMANNETGTLEPLAEAVAVARKKKILVHTDAVQAVGKVPVKVSDLEVDLLSMSAHKIHGPQGVGALYVRKGIELSPLLVGGSQERRRRAGTENASAIVGFGRAAELARQDAVLESPRVSMLRDRFEQQILERISYARVNGSREHRVPNTTNIGFEGVEGDSLLMALDLEGVAASLGAACSSGSLEPSHVLRAMHLPETVLRGSLRFSLSKFNTQEEIDRAVEKVCRVVERVQTVGERQSK